MTLVKIQFFRTWSLSICVSVSVCVYISKKKKKEKKVQDCMCVSVHGSTEHDSCLLVVFVLLKVVSLSALASSVNSVNGAEVSPRRSGKDMSC